MLLVDSGTCIDFLDSHEAVVELHIVTGLRYGIKQLFRIHVGLYKKV